MEILGLAKSRNRLDSQVSLAHDKKQLCWRRNRVQNRRIETLLRLRTLIGELGAYGKASILWQYAKSGRYL